MNNELYHHGIEGQKWGVMHGPPYPLSRSESRAIRKQAKREEKSRKAMEKRGLSYKGSKKYARRMTDEDLNAAIDRLQREETYRRMVSKDKEAKKASSDSKIQAIKDKIVQNQNKPDGTIKRSFKESAAGGIKTISGAAFNKLASELFKDAPSVDVYVDSTGKITVKSKDAKAANDTLNFLRNANKVVEKVTVNTTQKAASMDNIVNMVKNNFKSTPIKTKYDTTSKYVKPDIISSINNVVYGTSSTTPTALLNAGIPKEIMDMKITDVVKNT